PWQLPARLVEPRVRRHGNQYRRAHSAHASWWQWRSTEAERVEWGPTSCQREASSRLCRRDRSATWSPCCYRFDHIHFAICISEPARCGERVGCLCPSPPAPGQRSVESNAQLARARGRCGSAAPTRATACGAGTDRAPPTGAGESLNTQVTKRVLSMSSI